jgi:hypothetical protein
VEKLLILSGYPNQDWTVLTFPPLNGMYQSCVRCPYYPKRLPCSGRHCMLSLRY